MPDHERSKVNLGNFRELLVVAGEEKSKKPENKKGELSYLASKLPQSMLKNFDWFEERRIFKKLCRGDPMPRVSD